MRTRLLIGAGAALLLILFILGVFYWNHVTSSQQGSLSGARAGIEKQIRSLGGAKAYAAFTQEYAGSEFSEGHNKAHIFGEVLFDVKGISALGVCDTNFNYGCYHGFITEAIAAKGFTSIAKLTEACHATPVSTSCEHGIGHGIVEYLGHKNLEGALAACDLTEQPDPIAGCLGGVFMEYNLPIVFNEEGMPNTEVRAMAEGRPYDPCPTLAEKYQPACYFSLAQWWRQTLPMGDYATMGSLCALAPAKKQECYAGIGNIVSPSTGFTAARTIADCRLLPAEGVAQCLAYALGAMAGHADPAEVQKVCAALPPERRTQCGM